MLIINMIFINKHHSEQGHQKSDCVIWDLKLLSSMILIFLVKDWVYTLLYIQPCPPKFQEALSGIVNSGQVRFFAQNGVEC